MDKTTVNVFEKLKRINSGFEQKFAKGRSPFQAVTRLAEEVGELAAEVNHFQGSGVKRAKHGEPDKAKLAQEVKGVLLTALQVLAYYDAEPELRVSIDRTLERLTADGFLKP